MSRRSRAFVLPALVFPAVTAGLSAALMLVLLPLGPDAIVLHWSSKSDPRWAHSSTGYGCPGAASPRRTTFPTSVSDSTRQSGSARRRSARNW